MVLDAPDVVADQLYPQLYRSRDGVVRGLREHGFDVVRAAAWADERAVVFVELASAELPAVERHVGPPVSVGTHAERFYETYADDDGVYGPFVDDDGRYVVERDRDVRTAGGFARTELGTVALGARIESRWPAATTTCTSAMPLWRRCCRSSRVSWRPTSTRRPDACPEHARRGRARCH